MTVPEQLRLDEILAAMRDAAAGTRASSTAIDRNRRRPVPPAHPAPLCPRSLSTGILSPGGPCRTLVLLRVGPYDLQQPEVQGRITCSRSARSPAGRDEGADDPLLRADRPASTAGKERGRAAPLHLGGSRPAGLDPARPAARLLARGDPGTSRACAPSQTALRRTPMPSRAGSSGRSRSASGGSRRCRTELARMVAGCAGGTVAKCRVLEVLRDHSECLTEHDGE